MQKNLGAAYRNLPTGDREANLERAIAYFQTALQVYTREAFPIEWAKTQNKLAAYWAISILKTRARTQHNLELASSDLAPPPQALDPFAPVIYNWDLPESVRTQSRALATEVDPAQRGTRLLLSLVHRGEGRDREAIGQVRTALRILSQELQRLARAHTWSDHVDKEMSTLAERAKGAAQEYALAARPTTPNPQEHVAQAIAIAEGRQAPPPQQATL